MITNLKNNFMVRIIFTILMEYAISIIQNIPYTAMGFLRQF